MVVKAADQIGGRDDRIRQELKPFLALAQAEIEIAEGKSVIGGGSTPAEYLTTNLLCIRSAKYSAAQLEEKLRTGTNIAGAQHVPVLARVPADRLLLDLPTLFPAHAHALIPPLTAS